MVNTVTKLLELSSQNATPAPGSPANTSMTSGKKVCEKVCGQSCKCGRGTGRADGATRTGWTGADGRTGRAGGPGGRGSRADWADRGWAGRAGRIGLEDGPGGPDRQADRGDHVSRRRTGRTGPKAEQPSRCGRAIAPVGTGSPGRVECIAYLTLIPAREGLRTSTYQWCDCRF